MMQLCGHEEETLFHALLSVNMLRFFCVPLEEKHNIKLPRLHPRSWASDLMID
jgi:hypothetical protein